MRTTNSRTIITIIVVILLAGAVAIFYTQKGSNTSSDQSPPKSESSNEATQNDTAGTISQEEAEQAAIEKYGGTVKSTERDDFEGSPAWEVELRDSKYGRIEVKVDTKTGKILHYEQD